MKTRNPLIAILLTLLLPALGAFYNGQTKKGLCYLIGYPLYILLLLLLMPWTPFYLFLALASLPFILWLYIIIEQSRIARRIGAIELKQYQSIWGYIGILIAGIALSYATQYSYRFLVGARPGFVFRAVTSSMEPTLKPSDWLFVNYQLKQLGDYERGDLIVYRQPDPRGQFDDTVVVKRLVALPGDEVEMRGDDLVVNGQTIYADAQLDERSRRYASYHLPPGGLVVSAGHFFVLGDNLGGSADSRFYGPIPEDRIHGKLIWHF